MATLVILVIFVILAAFLFWISNCRAFKGPASDANLLWALAASAILMYAVWNLFGSSGVFWKIIDVLIIVLIVYSYWSAIKVCRFFDGVSGQRLP